MAPQPRKSVILLQSAGITAGGTASANLDCVGFDYLELDVFATTSNNATNNPSVLKLSESDITDATGFSDVTAFVGDGTGGFTVPASPTTTTANTPVKFAVDLRHRKRYLKLTVSPLTTQDIWAIAELAKAEVSPITTTDLGVAAFVAG